MQTAQEQMQIILDTPHVAQMANGITANVPNGNGVVYSREMLQQIWSTHPEVPVITAVQRTTVTTLITGPSQSGRTEYLLRLGLLAATNGSSVAYIADSLESLSITMSKWVDYYSPLLNGRGSFKVFYPRDACPTTGIGTYLFDDAPDSIVDIIRPLAANPNSPAIHVVIELPISQTLTSSNIVNLLGW
jgi:hypothetical protein